LWLNVIGEGVFAQWFGLDPSSFASINKQVDYEPSLRFIYIYHAPFLAQSSLVLVNLQIKGALKTISEHIIHHRQIKLCQHISHL